MRNILILIMIITNIILIVQIQTDRNNKVQEELNKRITLEELIPIDEFEVIGD